MESPQLSSSHELIHSLGWLLWGNQAPGILQEAEALLEKHPDDPDRGLQWLWYRANQSALPGPLSPSDRFLLGLFFKGRFSYARAGALCGCSSSDIGQRLWKARCAFWKALPPSERQACSFPKRPIGNSCHFFETQGEWLWMQRFLDEAWEEPRERFLIQNHLWVCESCREALHGFRKFYFSLDERLEKAWVHSLQKQGQQSLQETLRTFFKKSFNWVKTFFS